MSNSKKDNQTSERKNPSSVCIEIPREVMEREIICDVMALRDERYIKLLSEEDQKKLECGNPLGQIGMLSTEAILDLAGGGSFSNGTFCHGTNSFSKGVTCKILKRI